VPGHRRDRNRDEIHIRQTRRPHGVGLVAVERDPSGVEKVKAALKLTGVIMSVE
jgi:hypothetical protein